MAIAKGLLAQILVLQALLFSASGAEHTNRVSYGDINTGMREIHFESRYPSFKLAASGNFLELERRAISDFTISMARPRGAEVYDAFVEKMPVRIIDEGEGMNCDSPVGAVFLAHPRRETEEKGKEFLYSYDYLVCSGSSLIAPERVLEKYLEKYGNYDEKDYDRNIYRYLNVSGRYTVGVKPVTGPEGAAALIIKITDDKVFADAYEAWRGHVREVEDRARRKF